MRKNFKHGKWVKAPTPHADISKYIDKQTGKEDDDKPGSRVRKEGSTMKFKKPKKGRGAGRAAFRGGGRTNLLEELGRVEGERSNRNRRAEISRVHGELNKGYKKGGTVKRGWKLTTKPKTKSTLTGTDTTRGGGPDEGNVGYNKDFIYRHGKHREKLREEMEKRKKRRPEAHTPLRAKKGVGGIAKIIGKKAVDWIKKNKKTIKKEVYSPEGKQKTKDMLDKLKKKYPDSQMFGPKKAKGGRIRKGHGGSAAQQHYLQHGYGPTKAKLRTGKPKIAKKGWA